MAATKIETVEVKKVHIHMVQSGNDAALCCEQQRSFTPCSEKKKIVHMTFEVKRGSVLKFTKNFSAIEKGLKRQDSQFALLLCDR